MPLFRDKQGLISSTTPGGTEPFNLSTCCYNNKWSRTYQICPGHLGIRQTLWADQNMVLLFINTHLWQKQQSLSPVLSSGLVSDSNTYATIISLKSIMPNLRNVETKLFYNYLESRQAILWIQGKRKLEEQSFLRSDELENGCVGWCAFLGSVFGEHLCIDSIPHVRANFCYWGTHTLTFPKP